MKLISRSNFIFTISILLCFASCGSSNTAFKEKWTKKEAPTTFKARFETTKGNFDIVANREWSPIAVDRLYQLIKSEFYTDIAIYRVVPNYVAQFGIHNNAALNKAWNSRKVLDEPTIEKNLEGTIAFARGGKGSRTSQIFINLKSNSPRLDTLDYSGVKGFPVVAKITQGMDVVQLFYNGYAGKPAEKQDVIGKEGNEYLKTNFPKLDYINKAYIIK